MSAITVKKSVTIRRSIAEQIEERVGAGGFSRFINAAAEYRLTLLKAQEIAEDRELHAAPLTDEAREAARRVRRGE